MSSYGIGQGLERGVELAGRMIFAGLGASRQNQLLDLDQQRVNLATRALSLKAFGHPSAWENLDRSEPELSPAAVLAHPAR